MLGHEHRAEHCAFGDGLDLAAISMAQSANNVRAKSHRFLPHLQVPETKTHGAEHAAAPAAIRHQLIAGCGWTFITEASPPELLKS
jgi:hypothetical protein